MYVCICNAVTDRAIRDAASDGVRSFAELRQRTGCGDCCGSCEDLARDILDSAVQGRVLDLPLMSVAA
ncbi:MAG: (2Fe-2S)-binding protein [Dokdonella sp.]|uniref:(2Fe-2S)-binding protein n=1 Tax=Dokdonella sp. TaxID=2291710 RepID=UPI003263E11A